MAADEDISKRLENELERWLLTLQHSQPAMKNNRTKKISVPIYEFPCEYFPFYEENHSNGKSEIPADEVFADPDAGRGKTCLACGLEFQLRVDQLLHFKTEHHRLNLKRRLQGLSPLNAAEVPMLGEDLTVSNYDDNAISESGSETESGSESDNRDVAIDIHGTEVLDNPGTISASSYAEFENPSMHQSVMGKVWRNISSINGSTYTFIPSGWSWSVTVHECIFGKVCLDDDSKNSKKSEDLNPWRNLLRQVKDWQQNSTCAILLMRSGRFAGAVFDGGRIVLHKVLRRYTVRAKAGGGQSSHDNKGRKAKSMGAQLRRHGEKALKEDVQSLLQQWAGHLQSCHRIFFSIPKTMKSVIFDDSSTSYLLHRTDPRLVNVAFYTNRPTLDEVKVVHLKCTSVTFSDEPAALDKTVEASDVPVSPVPFENLTFTDASLMKTEASSDVQTADFINFQIAAHYPLADLLIRACTAGDEKTALQAIDSAHTASTSDDRNQNEENEHSAYDLSMLLNLRNSVEELLTPLHLATAKGMQDLIRCLLMNGADPTLRDVHDRVPYFMAKDKETRDTFRKCRAELGEETTWDWHAAGVGPALTEDAIQAQKLKEKEKKKRQAQRKKDQKKRQTEEAAAAVQTREEQKRRDIDECALLDEIARSNAGNCAICGGNLLAVLAFEVLDQRCCSSSCVQRLRRQLAADAAQKRQSNNQC